LGHSDTERMDEQPSGAGRTHGVDRLLGLSDAVVAIAATLLVLPLVQIVPNGEIGDVGALLSNNTNNFVAFVISFVVIYRFWLTHHHTFGEATQLRGALVWLNGLWLLSIAFLPFPTQLVGAQNTHDRLTNGLYIGTILVTAVCSVAGQWLVLQTSTNREHPVHPVRAVAPGLVLVATLLIALVVSVAIPSIGLWALLVLVVGLVISGQIRRRTGGGNSHG
jgi:uncharacterized membrane protein